jgi:hypothetical protein
VFAGCSSLASTPAYILLQSTLEGIQVTEASSAWTWSVARYPSPKEASQTNIPSYPLIMNLIIFHSIHGYGCSSISSPLCDSPSTGIPCSNLVRHNIACIDGSATAQYFALPGLREDLFHRYRDHHKASIKEKQEPQHLEAPGHRRWPFVPSAPYGRRTTGIESRRVHAESRRIRETTKNVGLSPLHL